MTNLTVSLTVGVVSDLAVSVPVRLAPVGAVPRTVATTFTVSVACGAREGVE